MDDDAARFLPSIGANVPLTFLSFVSSDDDSRFIGLMLLLIGDTSDYEAGTTESEIGAISLLFYRCYYMDGNMHWFFITDTREEGIAKALGLISSPKCGYVTNERDAISILSEFFVFNNRAGKVGLSHSASYIPCEDAPLPAIDGSCSTTGAAAFWKSRARYACSRLHFKVFAICPRDFSVTLSLTNNCTDSIRASDVLHRPCIHLDKGSPPPYLKMVHQWTCWGISWQRLLTTSQHGSIKAVSIYRRVCV